MSIWLPEATTPGPCYPVLIGGCLQAFSLYALEDGTWHLSPTVDTTFWMSEASWVSYRMQLPSGKHSQVANLKMAIEIVDFPMNSMVIFHSFVYVYQKVSYACSLRM